MSKNECDEITSNVFPIQYKYLYNSRSGGGGYHDVSGQIFKSRIVSFSFDRRIEFQEQGKTGSLVFEYFQPIIDHFSSDKKYFVA